MTATQTMTEFGLALNEVDAKRGLPQSLRKCTIMYELSVNLLRLLEFCADRCVSCLGGHQARALKMCPCRISELFVGDGVDGAHVSLTRLVELLIFAINRTTDGADAIIFKRYGDAAPCVCVRACGRAGAY